MQPESTHGWLVSGFQAMSLLWIWGLAMLTHGLWRSVRRPEPDSPRHSGPLG